MQRRILKMAFWKYKQQTRIATKDMNDLGKSKDYRAILIYRKKKRMFGGLKKFTYVHGTAKKFLKRVLINTDLRTKKLSMRAWKDTYKAERGDDEEE
mmetsp:Transcript_35546/g.54348  ORF Transcript_35546/g.54348 Transcript_35546/m.54348 type:complete len:97 (-) Transcript_35546:121-411(-)|eukprot:CAMPEP_0170503968 /NCGR_PEP_ID=MMETSP0208-20121228/46469_1 /TAXON_ID=197538 /ORGANISM="Strombidium inclinatum, Strain S3" /LENGTH=96 /DNA_ID=CAMNT_0010783933 /DNA_START=143 /DNA_END=433 /DNA_ORIENTATION=-